MAEASPNVDEVVVWKMKEKKLEVQNLSSVR
jgi:hypothetical protein